MSHWLDSHRAMLVLIIFVLIQLYLQKRKADLASRKLEDRENDRSDRWSAHI